MPHALLVDDDVNFILGLSEVVGREGFSTRTAHSLKDARAEIEKAPPDVVLIDLHLPDGNGLELFKDLEASPSTEIILITGQASVDTAVEAMRKGASDYLVKPVDMARVKGVLANVVRTRELKEQIGNLRGELRKLGRFGPLIGAAPPMQRVYDLIAQGRAHRSHRAATGRDRHRQGAGRGDDPRLEPPPQGSRSCPSTAAPSPRTSSRASCSATSGAASPARIACTRATSSAPIAARCSSTRSPRCRPSCR